MLTKLSYPIILIAALLIFPCNVTCYASEDSEAWQSFETNHTIINYQSIHILEQFNKAIHFGSGWWAKTSSFAVLTEGENKKIAALKTDALFERVQDILDMRKKFNKIKINIYPDKSSLETAFVVTYKQDCPFRAWYEYKTNTISINVKDLHEGMLAHEIAHGIIDHFFKVRPPKNTAEILAMYVDRHL